MKLSNLSNLSTLSNLPDEFRRFLSDAAGRGEILAKYDENLADLSGFKIGGPADVVIMPNSLHALETVVEAARSLSVRYDLFGNCSNLLFSDNGYRGAVILTKHLSGVSVDRNIISAECGASLMSVAIAAEKAALSGFEFAYGIPGTVGGAVCMNAGAYGGEISDVLLSADCISEDGTVRTLSKDECLFGYRHSIFLDRKSHVLSAKFVLSPSDRSEIRAEMDALMQKRREKQPLEYPSAGSVFKRYPGYYTAKLIEEAGFKGLSVGGAQVSTKHAGFIINRGGATAADVCELISLIKKGIYDREGIEIETEVIIVPEK